MIALSSEDISEVFALIKEYPSFSSWSESELERSMASGRLKLVGLRAADELVCVIGYLDLNAELEIVFLATHKDLRRSGKMNELLEDFLHSLGKQEVKLEVSASNVTAVQLYQKFAFIEVGRREKYYKDGSAAILLTWKKS